ncbi:MAG TPA: S9 family peptidase [Henriciella marina]|uniref:S9 family peptidase n=1 Tax=Henriciella sp. TaxID=1968823 RepID=UPI0017D86168|nr:alpha/beta fold hydrolase [Henriciella sp.]HIG24142.1 S9 family peptidase [Henriciella sp.]HIK63975.1 S9 family peptidase [Henriciella marina]
MFYKTTAFAGVAAAALISAPFAGAQEAMAPTTAERVTEGNLVMENIPDIPEEVSEKLRQYQNVRTHGFADWTDEGVLIATRFGEVSQIHQVKTPLGARRQVTFYDEPIGGASVSPTGGSFVFSKDTGGDEFYQGYLFDMESGGVTRFTEAGTRNGGYVWTDDGSQVFFYEARDGEADYDLKMGNPADPASIETVFEGDGTGALFPVDFSADGSMVTIQRYISIQDSDIFTFNVATGEMTEIRPGEEVAYDGLHFLSDGSLLTSTDAGSEFKNLVRLVPGSDEMTVYTSDIDWDVEGYDLSPDGSTVVFAVNEGGLGTIKLLDIESGEVTDGPDLPTGIAAGPQFDSTGSRVGFTFVGATSPADAWSFDVETLELTRWTEAEVGGLDTAAFVEPEMFDYPNADVMDIPAFIYRPAGEGPYPVIVSIHGGPEGQSRPYFSSTYQYWANELGAAVVVPNVRGSAGYGKTYVSLDNGLNRKKSVEDIGALLDWIDGQDDLDSDRVLVYGGSYGGYMVLASMVDYNDRLAGGIDIVGISDFKTFLENTKGYRRDLRRAEYGDERDPEIAAFFEEISPLNNASEITNPLFIIQGANDPRVPASEAEQILEAVRQNGGEAWFLLAMDEGHGFAKKSNRDFQREAETLFLQDVLELDGAE